jgi:O-acetyl-ADP-ribose deacetylase (regulator of RNase III)
MRIEAVRGDITAESVDAIVNAANSSLLGGGGVDGAIHAAAGPDLLEECRRLRRTELPDGLATGDAVATRGGRLPAAWVIHAVGPRRWEHPDGGAGLLASCHTRALAVADHLGVASVAFPAISCGAYGWTPVEAAPIAVAAVRAYASTHPSSGIEVVRFVLFTDEALEAFSSASSSVQ